jgi:hypothetical protein
MAPPWHGTGTHLNQNLEAGAVDDPMPEASFAALFRVLYAAELRKMRV